MCELPLFAIFLSFSFSGKVCGRFSYLRSCARFSGISGRKHGTRHTAHGTRPSLLRSTRKHLKTSTGSRFLSPRETYTQNPCFCWNRWRLQPRIRPPSLAIRKWWATVVEWRKHSSNVKRKKNWKRRRGRKEAERRKLLVIETQLQLCRVTDNSYSLGYDLILLNNVDGVYIQKLD